MAVINWGKPTIEIVKLENGAIPSSPSWTKLDTPVEGTTTLETTEGEKTEALDEGGAVVDTRKKKNKYSLKFSLFEKKGKEKPIEDEDGVITDEYAIRVTPEDSSTPGFILKKCSVSVQYTYNAADGGRFAYTFDALTPDQGKMLERYMATEE